MSDDWPSPLALYMCNSLITPRLFIGETKVILNEGMPQFKNIDNRGRLIIEFKVNKIIWLLVRVDRA